MCCELHTENKTPNVFLGKWTLVQPLSGKKNWQKLVKLTIKIYYDQAPYP